MFPVVSAPPARRAALYGITLVIFGIVFWAVRLEYWTLVHEAPYSDIQDYVGIGQNIAAHFFFGINEAYFSYLTPVTPSIIALSIWLGGEQFEAVFRLLVQASTFTASLFLIVEIAKLTGRRWLGASLVLVVALCRPSIFWSLKLGTEAVSEMLILWSLGACLYAIRTRSLGSAAFAGVLCLLLALNRPQFFPSLAAVAVVLALAGLRWRSPKRVVVPDKRRIAQSAVFVLAAVVVWSPWIIRNYVHYGAFIPTATSGIEVFVWEYGGGPVTPGRYSGLRLPDGTVFREFGLGNIRQMVRDSPNDYVRSKKFRDLGAAWVKANWMDIPALMEQRLVRFVTHNGASGLTTVPREALFETSARAAWLDRILIDKTPAICLLAIGGLALLTIRNFLAGTVVAGLVLLPWFVLSALIGYERTVESLISFTCWLAVYFVGEMLLLALSLRTLFAAIHSPVDR